MVIMSLKAQTTKNTIISRSQTAIGGFMGVKAVFRIAYSNQNYALSTNPKKIKKTFKIILGTIINLNKIILLKEVSHPRIFLKKLGASWSRGNARV